MFRALINSRQHKGIALIVALGTMILIFIVAALAIYLITRGLNVAGGQKRYQSTFEASEGGLEIGLANVESAFSSGADPDSFVGRIGSYNVTVTAQPLFRSTVAGAAIKYSRGYFGAGQGIAKGGVNLYYHIRSQAVALGVSAEEVILECEQKKVVGID